MLVRIDRWFGRLLGLVGAGVGILIGLMAVVMSIDVALRNFGPGNLAWVVEVSEYILFITAFLGAPWALRQGAHIRMDLVVLSLPPAWRLAAEILGDLLGLAVSVVMLWYGLAAVQDAYKTGTVIIKFLVVKEWWSLSIVPVAALLLSIEFLFRLARLQGAGGSDQVGTP